MIYVYIKEAVQDVPVNQYSHFSPISFKEGWIGCSDELVDPKRTLGDFFFQWHYFSPSLFLSKPLILIPDGPTCSCIIFFLQLVCSVPNCFTAYCEKLLWPFQTQWNIQAPTHQKNEQVLGSFTNYVYKTRQVGGSYHRKCQRSGVGGQKKQKSCQSSLTFNERLKSSKCFYISFYVSV